MARIGTVQLVFDVNTGTLEEGLGRARKSVEAFSASKVSTDRITKNLEKVAAAAGLSKESFDKLKASVLDAHAFDQATKALNRLERAGVLTGKSLSGMAAKMGIPNYSPLASKMKADEVAASRLTSVLQPLIATYASFALIKDIAQTSIKLDSVEKAFYAITGSMAGARGEMSYMREESQRLGLDFMALTESYKWFSAAAKFAGMDANTTREIFQAVSESSTVLGLSAEKTRLTLLALEQMISKGTVSMEELRRQLGDQLPGAFELGARAMGKTLPEFNKFVSSGQLMADVFLPRFASELKKTFGSGLTEAMKTPRAELQRLVNEVLFAKDTIGKNGFLDGIAEGARALREALANDDIKESLYAMSVGLGTVVSGLASATAFALEHTTALKRIIEGYAAFKIAARAGIGIGALGGPAGLAVTAGIAVALEMVTNLAFAMSEGERLAAKYGVSLAEIKKEFHAVALASGGMADSIVKNVSAARDQISQVIADLKSRIAEATQLTGYKIDAYDFTIEFNIVKSDKGLDIQKELQAITAEIQDGTSSAEQLKTRFDAVGASIEELAKAKGIFSDERNDAQALGSALDQLVVLYSALIGKQKELAAASVQKDYDGQVNAFAEYLKTGEAAISKYVSESKEFKKQVHEDKILAMEAVQAQQQALAASGDKEAVESLKKTSLALAQARKDIATLNKEGQNASLSADRTAYQASQSYDKALDTLAQLKMRTSEFQAELNGETLLVAMTKIDEKIETQKNKIDKDLAALMQKEAQWRKTGKLDAEGQADISSARENLELQKQELEIQKALQYQIAQRKSAMEDLRHTIDYAELVGNLQMQYAAEVQLLEIQKEGVSVAEARVLAEKMRIAEARANLNSIGLMQTGINNLTREANQSIIDFWEQALPNAVSTTSGSFADCFMSLVDGTANAQQAFTNLANAFHQMAMNIIKDLIEIGLRMAITGMFSSFSFGGASGGTSASTPAATSCCSSYLSCSPRRRLFRR